MIVKEGAIILNKLFKQTANSVSAETPSNIPASKHKTRFLFSSVTINATPETIWKHITDVQIEQFSDPLIFKLLGIPKPLRAEVLAEGVGGKRIAYFNTGKRFIQEITAWKPYKEYSFLFNPEQGFIVGHFFDLHDGTFRVPSGSYLLTRTDNGTLLQLETTYSIDKRFYFLLALPVRIILMAFQRYLLRSIKKNSEHETGKIR